MAGNANSGRSRKPHHLKVVDGTASRGEFDAARVIDRILESVDPGCPADLTADAQEEWKRVVEDALALAGVKALDRAQLSVYCQAWADWIFARRKISELGERGYVEITPSGYRQLSPWVQLANRAAEQMRSFGDQFGFSPTARARLDVNAGQGDLFAQDPARHYF